MPPKISQWFLTYPQCAASAEELLAHLDTLDKVIHYVIATEQHKDGNQHLHAYVKYVDGVYKKQAPSKFDFAKYHGNYQPVRSAKSVVKYCTKENNYLSNFDISTYTSKKGKLSVDIIKSKSAAAALTDGDISFLQVRAYQAARSVLELPYEHTGERGLWIYGPPRVGKSRIIREFATLNGYRLFSKGQNRWFDGYDGEELIMIDDYDQRGNGMDHLIKIWTDRYACAGEIKGSTVQLRHKVFAVTSNFTIDEIFKDVPEVTREAIRSRFRVIYMQSYDDWDPLSLLKREDKVLKCSTRKRTNGVIGDNRMTFTEVQVYDRTSLRKNPKVIKS